MNEIERREHTDAAKLVGGLILIGIGILFLLDRLNIADFGHLMRHWWPLIPGVVGLPKLFRRQTFWAGGWLIMVSVWLLISANGWFGLRWDTSWPLLLIFLGGGLILRAFVEAMYPDETRT